MYNSLMFFKILLTALAYIIPIMPYAYFWHMVWFKKKYEKWEYFDRDASVPIGFTSIIIQGIVLSYAYAILPIEHNSLVNCMYFSAILGIFFWSTHVVSAMAKHGATRTKGYFVLETVYLVGQFGIFGLLMSAVYDFA